MKKIKSPNSYHNISGQFQRTVVVGDIHGCFAEFVSLLEAVHFSSSDVLISVGDFMDRGPDSWAVADFFYTTGNACAVAGNHERRIAGVIRGTSEPAWTQLQTLSLVDTEQQDGWAVYFESLPAVIESPHAIVTHARLDPNQPIDKQNSKYTCAVGGKSMNSSTGSDGVPLWYTKWRTSCIHKKPLCIGHVKFSRVVLAANGLYALDTGCAEKGFLSAVVFPEGKIVQVKCARNYRQEAYDRWQKKVLRKMPSDCFPIYRFFELRGKDHLNSVEKSCLDRFVLFLNSLDTVSRVQKIKVKILNEFGEIPAPGEERGNYFMKIRRCAPLQNSRALNMIVSSKPFSLELFLRIFEGQDLHTVDQTLKELEQWITGQGGSQG